MRKPVRGTLSTALLVATIALAALFAGQASADTAGTVHFVRSADSAFDQYTASPSPTAAAWLRSHMWRMLVYSPYFDTRTASYPNGWVYDDAYAIYAGQSLAASHPEWILKDAQGNKLYIPFGCTGGACPQYAGDIGDPAFRHYWIESLKARVAHGYKGVFVDDVNMDMRVGNGQGQAVAPIDPASGQPMGQDAWRHYMATFMGEVRAALANVEIVHNVIWYAAEHAGSANPDIRAELSAANFVNLERGANDSGITGGSGAWSLGAFLSYVDEIHGLGRNVILDGSASDAKGIEYELAAYLLVSNGNDAVSAAAQTPTNWWGGWGTNLGAAAAPRYAWQNLQRRDFSGGMVLLNPPGEPTRTVSLQSPMRDAGGSLVSSVTLEGASASVLAGNSAPAPPGESSPAEPQATQTILEPKVLGPAAGPHAKLRGGKASARQAKHRRTRAVLARIGGRVLRATQGSVMILVQVRRHHRWVELRHLTTKLNARGRFGRLLRLQAGRHYRVRAVYKGAPGYRPSHSSYRRITARAR